MSQNAINNQPVRKSRAETAPDVADAMRLVQTRSPQESLGVHTEHGLSRAFIQATVLVAIVFFGWTAGAYVYDRQFPPPPKAEKKAPAEANDKANTPAVQPGPDTSAKKGPDAKENPSKSPGKKDIVDHLGEGGTKKGNPSNPLDRKDDDLFKDSK